MKWQPLQPQLTTMVVPCTRKIWGLGKIFAASAQSCENRSNRRIGARQQAAKDLLCMKTIIKEAV